VKLGALHFYQLAIPAPKPPQGTFDENAAVRGKEIFEGQAKCSTCHVPPLFTEPGWNLHTPEEIGIDNFQASRAPDKRYRTSPLKGIWTHTKRGFFHDGRFAPLDDVVRHYDNVFRLGLSDQQVQDLVEYLKSLWSWASTHREMSLTMPRQGKQEGAIFLRFDIVGNTLIEYKHLPRGQLHHAIWQPKANVPCESLHRDPCRRFVFMHAHLLPHRQ
jgi:hypothetical protein